MNSQLFAHLEAFEKNGDGDDDDGNDNNNGWNVKDNDNISSMRCITDDTKETRSFTAINIQQQNDVIFIKVMAIVPIGVALIYFHSEESFHINHFLLTIILLWVFLVCSKNKILERLNDMNTDINIRPKKVSINRQQKLQMISQDDDDISFFSLITNNEKSKEKLYNCRREVSRLLGLVGAPPMALYKNDDDDTILDASPDFIIINDVGTTSVIEFLEAHVQFILSIDEALYWIKISSSLHWGLGPHSQCVERVERAAVTTTYNHRKINCGYKYSDDRNHNHNDTSSLSISSTNRTGTASLSYERERERELKLEPQRKLDTSSILALSSTRRNIAEVIVNESQSIIEAITAINECILQKSSHSCSQQHCRQGKQQSDVNIDNDSRKYKHRFNNEVIFQYIVNNGLLFIPDVIDLAWIKSSRKHLANLLSNSVDYLSTIDSLETLSVDLSQPRSILIESMGNARNLREYIHGNILLNNESCSISPMVSTTSSGTGSTDHKFMISLLQYRQQLDALNAALWSYQQYTHHQSSSYSACATTISNNDSSLQFQHHQEQVTNNSVKMTWWNQVKELSATCQSFERDIENRFISLNEHAQGTDSKSDDGEGTPCQGLTKDHKLNESRSYEHTGEKVKKEMQKKEHHNYCSTAKTLVFTGKGAKEITSTKTKPKISMDSGQMNDQADAVAMSLPPSRNIIMEQLLVRELQTRIRTVVRHRDEEHVVVNSRVSEIQEECNGDDDLQEHTNEGSNKGTTTDNNGFRENTFIGDATRYNEINKTDTIIPKREAATNLFLGISGSLLDELKNKLPTNKFQIDERFS